MKKIFNIVVLSLAIFIFNIDIGLALDTNGDADIYKVTMRKVELCTGYTVVDFDDILTDAACHDAVVVGSGDKEVDIASVSAGMAAAAYGQAALLPLGATYTHVRVTVDRNFKIRTEEAIDIGGTNAGQDETDNCVTIATTDTMYATDEATDKYTHVPAVAEGGTRAEMSVYIRNGRELGETTNNYTQCLNADCSTNSSAWSWDYASVAATLGDAIAMSIARSSDMGVPADDVVLVYALSSPYTVTLIPPTIDLSFGTRNSIKAQEVCAAGDTCNASGTDGFCMFSPQEPQVTITIK